MSLLTTITNEDRDGEVTKMFVKARKLRTKKANTSVLNGSCLKQELCMVVDIWRQYVEL